MVGEGLHIGIILDGNRRFAKKSNIPMWKGHRYGARKIDELVDWSLELDIRELTLYSFSMENFRRVKKEKDVLFRIFRAYLKKLDRDERIEKQRIRINFIGRLEMFPKDIYEHMREIMERTMKNDNYTINFAMAYGGRAEIVDAAKKIADKVESGKIKIEEIDEELITSNLYLADEPDLIIRPGGEKRVSNFLIWQGYYSEWYFTDKLWPEFTKEDMIKAIDDYKVRERRFGK